MTPSLHPSSPHPLWLTSSTPIALGSQHPSPHPQLSSPCSPHVKEDSWHQLSTAQLVARSLSQGWAQHHPGDDARCPEPPEPHGHSASVFGPPCVPPSLELGTCAQAAALARLPRGVLGMSNLSQKCCHRPRLSITSSLARPVMEAFSGFTN